MRLLEVDTAIRRAVTLQTKLGLAPGQRVLPHELLFRLAWKLASKDPVMQALKKRVLKWKEVS
jgi:aminoglycoside N3'-acetyltransferase